MVERGFTLLELMVAVAIFGILSAMAYPSYQSWRNSSGLDRDSRILQGVLGRARSSSIQEGMYWGQIKAPTVTGVNCSRLYYGGRAVPGSRQIELIYFCDQDGDGAVDGAGEIETVETYDLADGVSIDKGSTLDSNRIFFNKGGEVFGSAGSVFLTAGNLSQQVVVSNNGRIRVQ